MSERLPGTILHPKAFSESPPAGFDGAMHWEYLNEVFQPYDGITCCDVDAEIERGKVFLGIETKNPGVPIPVGQERRTQAKLDTGLYSHLDIWGKEIPKRWRLRTWWNRNTQFFEGEDCRAAIAERAAAWIRWADKFMDRDQTYQRDYMMLNAAWKRACPRAREAFTKALKVGR